MSLAATVGIIVEAAGSFIAHVIDGFERGDTVLVMTKVEVFRALTKELLDADKEEALARLRARFPSE